MRVLVVEDDTGCRLLLKTMLAQRGHDVECFPSAEEALGVCRSSEFQIALLNWSLPGMDGTELCIRLRDLRWGRRLQVLMVSACDTSGEVERLLDLGADDVVIKPIDPAVLAVRLVVAEHRVRAASRAAFRERPATVLIVEDCEDTRLVLVDALKGIGYSTLVAGDGAEALELLEQVGEDIALVITDLSMPRMDGRELYARCRRLDPRIGFLFCTGCPVDGTELGICGDRRAAVVEKPVTVAALARIIRRVLHGEP